MLLRCQVVCCKLHSEGRILLMGNQNCLRLGRMHSDSENVSLARMAVEGTLA